MFNFVKNNIMVKKKKGVMRQAKQATKSKSNSKKKVKKKPKKKY